MLLNRLIGSVFAGALAFSAGASDLVVRIAPPRIKVEKRGHPPSRAKSVCLLSKALGNAFSSMFVMGFYGTLSNLLASLLV